MSNTLLLRIAVVIGCLGPGQAQGLEVPEPGFQVEPLQFGNEATSMECSPGGAFGDFVYIVDVFDFSIRRIDSAGSLSLFSSFPFPLSAAAPFPRA